MIKSNKNNKKNKPMYKLLVAKTVGEPTINSFGQKVIRVKWIEVEEINMGSVKEPNREILGYRLEPIQYEEDESDSENNMDDLFKRFFK